MVKYSSTKYGWEVNKSCPYCDRFIGEYQLRNSDGVCPYCGEETEWKNCTKCISRTCVIDKTTHLFGIFPYVTEVLRYREVKQKDKIVNAISSERTFKEITDKEQLKIIQQTTDITEDIK